MSPLLNEYLTYITRICMYHFLAKDSPESDDEIQVSRHGYFCSEYVCPTFLDDVFPLRRSRSPASDEQSGLPKR